MSLDKLYPFAGDHAIQNAAFALEWPGELSAAAISNMLGLTQSLAKYLPNSKPQKLVTLNLDTLDSSGVGSSHDLGGMIFERRASPNVLGRTLTISRPNCIAVVHDYTRWNPVWAEVKEYFNIVLPMILKEVPISVIGLQYTDTFNWKGRPADLDIAEVFNKKTELLPSNVFALNSLWHSHHGYFIEANKEQSFRRLDNVNVNLLENNGMRVLQIVTSHRAILDQDKWLGDPQRIDIIDTVMNSLHSTNKTILRDLLSDDVKAKINLNAPE